MTQNKAMILVSQSFATVKLDPEKEYAIGRDKDADIAIVQPDVSRRHALIGFTEAWVIHDLKSRNGTKVNGTFVDSSPLVDGDVVQIGTAIFSVVEVALSGQADGALLEQYGMAYRTTLDGSDVMTGELAGDLTEIGLLDAVQMIGQIAKTGTLSFHSEQGECGHLIFRDGQICGAEWEPLHGREAAMAIMTGTFKRFSFSTQVEKQTTDIQESTMWLIFEASRILDEKKRGDVT